MSAFGRPGVLRTWGFAGTFVVVGVLVSASQFMSGRTRLGVFELVAFGIFAVVLSPLVFPRSITAEQARLRAAEDGRPIIYWRPGCSYCLRLRRKLGRRGRTAYWVNIWSDPAGAAAVREITGGDETVPTVVAGAEQQVNPSPRWVLEQLR